MISIQEPRSRSVQPLVASAAAAAGGALLAYRAVRTFGADPYGTLEPAAGVAVGLLALTAFATALMAARLSPRASPRRAGALGVVTLIGAVLVDWLPVAPPRLIHLLPLSVAAGLLLVATPAASTGTGPEGSGATTTLAGPPAAGRRWAAIGWVGLALHVAVGVPYLVSGLVAPLYGVLLLWIVWGLLLVVLLRVHAGRPAWALVVPFAALATWYAVLHLGGAALGWQA